MLKRRSRIEKILKLKILARIGWRDSDIHIIIKYNKHFLFLRIRWRDSAFAPLFFVLNITNIFCQQTSLVRSRTVKNIGNSLDEIFYNLFWHGQSPKEKSFSYKCVQGWAVAWEPGRLVLLRWSPGLVLFESVFVSWAAYSYQNQFICWAWRKVACDRADKNV